MGTIEGYTCAVDGCDAETINAAYAATQGRVRRDGSWLCPEHKHEQQSS